MNVFRKKSNFGGAGRRPATSHAAGPPASRQPKPTFLIRDDFQRLEKKPWKHESGITTDGWVLGRLWRTLPFWTFQGFTRIRGKVGFLYHDYGLNEKGNPEISRLEISILVRNHRSLKTTSSYLEKLRGALVKQGLADINVDFGSRSEINLARKQLIFYPSFGSIDWDYMPQITAWRDAIDAVLDGKSNKITSSRQAPHAALKRSKIGHVHFDKSLRDLF